MIPRRLGAAAFLALVGTWPVVQAQQNLGFDANGVRAGSGGSAVWNTTAPIWFNGTAFQPWDNTRLDNAVFAGSAGAVTLGQLLNAHDLRFDVGGYLLTGGPLTLVGLAPTLTTNLAVTTLNATLAGNAGLVKNGTGTLVLGGNNTALTGVTTVNAGTLRIHNAGALGPSTAAANLVLNAGSTFFFNTAFTHDYTLNGGTVTVQGAAVAWSGVPVLTAATTLRLGSTIGGSTLSGNLADTGGHVLSLVRNGSASMKLSGSNSYSGATTIERGNLQLDSAGALPGASPLVFAGAAGAGGALELTAASGDFTRSVGTGAGQVQWLGDGGFQSSGSNRAVDLGGSRATLTWGSGAFVPEGSRLVLGTASNNLLDLRNGIDLSGGSRAVEARGGTVTGHAVISGVLSGTGGLHLVGNGILALSAANTYSGGTRLDGGTLMWSTDRNLGAPSGAVVFGGGTLHNTGVIATARPMTVEGAGGVIRTGMDLKATGPIDGFGTLVKEGLATLTLGGDSSAFAGTTRVTAGTLRVDGALGGTLAMAYGTTLKGAGTVGTTLVQAGATVAPGNSIGGLRVAGDLTLAQGSLYQVEASGDGRSDSIQATGRVTLQGGALSILANGNWAPSTEYTILGGGDGVVGGFGSATSSLAFLDPILVYGPQSVALRLVRNDVSFPAVGQTPNQQAVGAAVQQLPAGPLYGAVVQLDAPAARNAFDQLSGELHTSLKSAAIEDTRFVRDAGIQRVRQALGQTGPQAGIVDLRGVWTRAFGSWASASGDGNARGVERSTSGVLIGTDTTVGDGWRAGVLGGYSRGSLGLEGRDDSASSESLHLGLYGGRQWGPVGLRIGASLTRSSVDTRRAVGFGRLADTPTAHYTAQTGQIYGDLGWNLVEGSSMALEPFVGLTHITHLTDAFAERGGSAALTAGSSRTSTGFSTLGLRGSSSVDIGATSVALRGVLGWRHVLDEVAEASALSLGGQSAFLSGGVPLARNVAVIEAGFGIAVRRDLTLGGSYMGQIGGSTREHGITARMLWTF